MFTRKTILKKTLEVSSSTLLSRVFGILREFLMARYLGASGLSDAFLTAYKIPNSLRKIFAEGALSAALIPTIVQAGQTDKNSVNSIITLSFLFFEGLVLLICGFVMWQAELVIRLIAGGFSDELIQTAVPWLQVLMPFIFFISSSALLAGALQSVGHFFVPAFSAVLLNIVFVSGLLVCLFFQLPVIYLCWFILFGGLLQLLWHLNTYFRLHFGFGSIYAQDIKRFKTVLWKFLLCLPAASVEELNLFIDTSFASYLPEGSMSLIYYANRFMGIPIGVFGVALATILLPFFSRVSVYAPKRLRFYLLESTKLIVWVMLPAALLMVFFADKIFITLFLSKKLVLAQAFQAARILQVFLFGLIFMSLNKILRNIYYALHEMWIPAVIALVATGVNILVNWLFLHWLQAPGLALATVISSAVQTVLFMFLLYKKFNFTLYLKPLGVFLYRYCLQLVVLWIPFWLLYRIFERVVSNLPDKLAHWLLNSVGFWFWVGPLSCLFAFGIFYFRRTFKVHLYFID